MLGCRAVARSHGVTRSFVCPRLRNSALRRRLLETAAPAPTASRTAHGPRARRHWFACLAPWGLWRRARPRRHDSTRLCGGPGEYRPRPLANTSLREAFVAAVRSLGTRAPALRPCPPARRSGLATAAHGERSLLSLPRGRHDASALLAGCARMRPGARIALLAVGSVAVLVGVSFWGNIENGQHFAAIDCEGCLRSARQVRDFHSPRGPDRFRARPADARELPPKTPPGLTAPAKSLPSTSGTRPASSLTWRRRSRRCPTSGSGRSCTLFAFTPKCFG